MLQNRTTAGIAGIFFSKASTTVEWIIVFVNHLSLAIDRKLAKTESIAYK
jgi:hypothetical protein